MGIISQIDPWLSIQFFHNHSSVFSISISVWPSGFSLRMEPLLSFREYHLAIRSRKSLPPRPAPLIYRCLCLWLKSVVLMRRKYIRFSWTISLKPLDHVLDTAKGLQNMQLQSHVQEVPEKEAFFICYNTLITLFVCKFSTDKVEYSSCAAIP